MCQSSEIWLNAQESLLLAWYSPPRSAALALASRVARVHVSSVLMSGG
jgi:hypothetical protein